jgi:hypothetical protein
MFLTKYPQSINVKAVQICQSAIKIFPEILGIPQMYWPIWKTSVEMN